VHAVVAKYSPIVQPDIGARNCIGAGSEAVARDDYRIFERAVSSSTLTNWATVERFWPIAT